MTHKRPHLPSFTLWEAYMASLIRRGNWRMKLPQFFKTLLWRQRCLQENLPLGFSLSSSLTFKKPRIPPQRKVAEPGFLSFKWPLSSYLQPKFYAGLFSSHQEMCRKGYMMIDVDRHTSQWMFQMTLHLWTALWFGKALVDHGVQFLTSDCTLSRPQDCEAWCCRSCWPLSWAPWPPSSTAPAPSSPSICTPRSGREHLRKSSS